MLKSFKEICEPSFRRRPRRQLFCNSRENKHHDRSYNKLKDHVFRDGSLVGTATLTNYLDAGLQQGTEYCYTVSANYPSGESQSTNESCAFWNPSNKSLAAKCKFYKDCNVGWDGLNDSVCNVTPN